MEGKGGEGAIGNGEWRDGVDGDGDVRKVEGKGRDGRRDRV